MLFSFDNRGYAPLIVRIVMPGDSYGKDMCIVHGRESRYPTPEAHLNDPLVEFYDARHPFDRLSDNVSAQFISRYYLSTLTEGLVKGGTIHGLDLDGGVPSWTANGETMRGLSAILSHLVIA
jgi:hypothetical protein